MGARLRVPIQSLNWKDTMRYKEAYELIDAAMLSVSPNFPITTTIKNKFFDDNVSALGLRFVRKLNEEEFDIVTDQKEYVFTRSDATRQIYRVKLGTTILPLISRAQIADPDDLFLQGYYYDEKISGYGEITNVVGGSTTSLTVSSQPDLVAGDYINIQNMTTPDKLLSSISVNSGGSGYDNTAYITFTGGGGTGAAATLTIIGGVVQSITITNRGSGYTSVPTVNIIQEVFLGTAASVTAVLYDVINVLNGTRVKVATINGNIITVNAITVGQSIAADGDYQQETKKIVLAKEPSATIDKLTVIYYASPRKRGSLDDIVDLPERLVKSAVHYVISDLMNIDNKFKLADKHRSLGAQHEADFMLTDRNREAAMDILPAPMGDFI